MSDRLKIPRERRRQPQTIEELLAPDRVWVTPGGCWLWLGGDDGGGEWHGLGAYGRILRPGTRRVMPVRADPRARRERTRHLGYSDLANTLSFHMI